MSNCSDEDRIGSLSELSDEWKDAVKKKSRELHDPNWNGQGRVPGTYKTS